MILAAKFDIVVNRRTPATYVFEFQGLDFTFTGATVHVRPYRDHVGAPLIEIDTSSGGGITKTVATVDGLPVSTLTLDFPELDIDAIPFTVPPGTDLTLVYDLVSNGGDVGRHRLIEGDFIVRAGVTR